MRRRVLSIDDEAATRTLVTALLEREGCEVRAERGGPSGLLAAEAEPPDVILVDVQMPGVDGARSAGACAAARAPRTSPLSC